MEHKGYTKILLTQMENAQVWRQQPKAGYPGPGGQNAETAFENNGFRGKKAFGKHVVKAGIWA